MKITALRAHPKNNQRVDVYLDGKRAFSLTVLVAATLRVGQQLSPAEVAQLEFQGLREEAHDTALRYLGYRPRSIEEMRRYLAKRNYPPEVQEATIARLRQSGLINDGDFAQYWVENRERFRPRSRRALRYELRQKGVEADAIDRAINSVDEEVGAYELAHKQAERLWRQGADRRTFQHKLGQYLAQRGYAYEVIRQVVSRLKQEWHDALTSGAEDDDLR